MKALNYLYLLVSWDESMFMMIHDKISTLSSLLNLSLYLNPLLTAIDTNNNQIWRGRVTTITVQNRLSVETKDTRISIAQRVIIRVLSHKRYDSQIVVDSSWPWPLEMKPGESWSCHPFFTIPGWNLLGWAQCVHIKRNILQIMLR